MIRLEHVRRSYPTHHGQVTVLKDVNFHIERGEKVGILGKNGAGKSTMIRLISGAEKPDSGRVIRDMSVSWPLAFGGGFQGALTGIDNLRFICRIYGQDWRDHVEYVEEFTELGRFMREPMSTYSSGMRSRLAFALSMVIDFDCFLIDEIMAVGDHRFHERCYIELFQKRVNHAMIFVSHDPGFLRDSCQRISVLTDGMLHNFDDLEEGFQFYYRGQALPPQVRAPQEGALNDRKQEIAGIIFGPDHAGVDFSIDTADHDAVARWVFAHSLNSDPRVAQYRLDRAVTAEELSLLWAVFGHIVPGNHIGRSLHGVLADYAETRTGCEVSRAFLQNFERYAPMEGPNGIWARMSVEGGVIRRITSFKHAPTGRELPLRVEFTRLSTHVHEENELAQFTISEDGVTCRLQACLPVNYAPRIYTVYPLIMPYLEQCELSGGFDISLGDEGLMGHVLSFCSVLRDYLVPDPYFIQTAGYAQERQVYGIAHRWDELKDQAYWRGTDTGVFRYRTYADAPRVAAALMSRQRPDILDARITRIELRPGHIEKEAWYNEMGVMGPEEDQASILNYRYQIDIDGNTNTWSSLFLKLLTGTPVLKVESEFGFRQWYYDRLVPWENYVPVAADASDLVEKIEWLRANPQEARRIGLAGRKLADSVTYDESVGHAHATLARLVALNRRRNL